MQLIGILHDIRSVHNVGSIFRTADGVGFEKLYLCGITPAPVDRFKKIRPDFAKVALGAEKSVVWESVPDVVPLVKKLKKEGWKIFAIEQAKNSMPYYLASDVLWNDEHQKAALVVGNEVGGIPPAILKLADAILEIPMLGKKESLNVSVAFGIAAYRSRFH
jgi:23S rRNA (guanosine2251-2'-O)-methyltransferase